MKRSTQLTRSALALFLFLPVLAYGGEGRIRKQPGALRDRYIVVFEDWVDRQDAAMIAENLGRSHSATIHRVWTSAIKGFVATMTEGRAEGMSHDPRVKFIEEDAEIAVSTVVPTNIDPACDPAQPGGCSTVVENRLWSLDRVEQDSPVLNNRFGYCSTGAGSYIYVVDTGVNAQHSEFWNSESDHTASRVTIGYNACEIVPTNPNLADHLPANNPCGGFSTDVFTRYGNGHGTSVASVAAGRQVGIARGATIVPVKVITCNQDATTTSMLTEGLDWIVRVPNANNTNHGNPEASYDSEGHVRLSHPSVVTLSTYRRGDDNSTGSIASLELALDAIDAANVAVVASANNQNDDACNTTPARHSRDNPNAALRGKVITAGGMMIKNSPLVRPVGGGPYDASQPTRDARWVCDSTDDGECAAGPVPTSTNAYYLYTKGSNWGRCVSLFVPAKNITSAAMGGERDYRTGLGGQGAFSDPPTTYSSGTSFSAPFVAGFIARMLQSNPSATPDLVFEQVTSATKNGLVGMLETSTLGTGSPNVMLRLGDVRLQTIPLSIGVDSNGDAVLSVSATTGVPPVSYQWFKVDSPSFVPSAQEQRGWSTSSLIGGNTSSITVHPSQKTSYRVRALNDCCETDSNVATVFPRPPTPTNFTATPTLSGTFVDMSWSAVSGADFYHIERKAAGSGFVDIGGSSSNSHTVSVSPNAAYVFRVRASAGDETPRTAFSGYSNNDLATTTVFSDQTIVAGTTTIRATHVTEMRKAANSLCDLLGISRIYSDSSTLYTSLQGQVVSSAAWNDLRTQINNLRTNPGIGVGAFNFRDVLTNGVLIKKNHIDDLRSSVQ